MADIVLQMDKPPSHHSGVLEVTLVPRGTERTLFEGHILQPMGEVPRVALGGG